MERRLIINADDLGINAQRSHGIFQCAEFGVVTSASLYPNSTESDAAARHARERKLPTGLHLNLTEEYPLSKRDDLPGLVDRNGTFIGLAKLRQALKEERIPRSTLEREVRMQVEWFLDAHGSTPTHIDSHDHVHLLPAIAETLIPIMERYGLRFVRMPKESPLPPFGYEVAEDVLAFATRLGQEADTARTLYEAHGIGTSDHFRGITLLGNSSLKNMRHMIGKLLPGVTELMVHPGSAITYGTPFDLDPQRQTELRMLLDPSIKEELAERKITLCSWADL